MFKEGGHRLFERDQQTALLVGQMLADLEAHGLEAVRRYSRKFDDWDPPSFELTPAQIEEAVGRLVRAFVRAQAATLRPLEVELRPGVVLGHRHIPVSAVGAYIPGGRYPMFGSAQMSITRPGWRGWGACWPAPRR